MDIILKYEKTRSQLLRKSAIDGTKDIVVIVCRAAFLAWIINIILRIYA